MESDNEIGKKGHLWTDTNQEHVANHRQRRRSVKRFPIFRRRENGTAAMMLSALIIFGSALILVLLPATGWTQSSYDMSILSGALTSMELFLEAYQDLGDDPERVAGLFALAMLTFTRDEALGTAQITAMLTDADLGPGDVYQGRQPGPSMRNHLKRLQEKPYLARSYFQGTTPENGYRIPADRLAVDIKPDPVGNAGPDRVKLFVVCSGADSPRPMTLARNDQGRWKVAEASSLFVGIRPPK